MHRRDLAAETAANPTECQQHDRPEQVQLTADASRDATPRNGVFPEKDRPAPVSSEVRDAAALHVAGVLDALIRERFTPARGPGDESATNEALARRLGVNERQMRRLRLGDKRVAVGDLLLFPDWLARGLLDAVETKRGRDPMVSARRALTDAVRAGLTDAQRSELAAILFGGSR